jgi:hypothetical protein
MRLTSGPNMTTFRFFSFEKNARLSEAPRSWRIWVPVVTDLVLRLRLKTVPLVLLLDPEVSLEAIDTNDEDDEHGVDSAEYAEEADEDSDECDSSVTARCRSSTESPNDSTGGNAGASASAGPFPMRLCTKWGIVAIRGERAQGFVDVRSCSSVGSIKLQ